MLKEGDFKCINNLFSTLKLQIPYVADVVNACFEGDLDDLACLFAYRVSQAQVQL